MKITTKPSKADYIEYMNFITGHMIDTRPMEDVVFLPYTDPGFVKRTWRRGTTVMLRELFPDAKSGDYVYVSMLAKCQCDSVVSLATIGASSYVLDGKEIEIDKACKKHDGYDLTDINLKEGYNELALKCECKNNAFELTYVLGHVFYPTWWTCDYILWTRDTSPVNEYHDETGFGVSELIPAGSGKGYKDVGLVYPKASEDDSVIDFDKLYDSGDYAIAYSCAMKDGTIELSGDSIVKVYVNGESCKLQATSYKLQEDDRIVVVCKRGDDWGFECKSNDILGLPFVKSNRKNGMHWALLGGFDTDECPAFTLTDAFTTPNGKTYWRFADGKTYLRPYLDTSFFGQWFYGLMVGQYGILQASLQRRESPNLRFGNDEPLHGSEASRNDTYYEYFRKGMHILVDFFFLEKYDYSVFGDSSFLKRSILNDDFDSIGTMGMNMYELYLREDDEEYKEKIFKVLQSLADSALKIPRMDDGTFYRVQTMWADDTFMSCPFLVRMGNLTGDVKYYDEVVRQLKLYTEKLYMDDINVFSHIFFPDKMRANHVPWGRGNGWVYLAFAEVISHLPDGYEGKADLIEIFKKAVEGVCALQDESGLWHQVLNIKESYLETSCTVIFSIAIARGIKMGILDKDTYLPIIEKAVCGVLRDKVDDKGNIFGVCRGSECKDDPAYYMNLETNYNDDHGTGVLITALCEVIDLID